MATRSAVKVLAEAYERAVLTDPAAATATSASTQKVRPAYLEELWDLMPPATCPGASRGR